MIRPQTKPLHHAAAHDAPAQRAHHFPEHDACWIGPATGGFVAGEQILARTETANGFVDLAEAPGVDANPAEILHRVAEMRELPIEHGAHAIGTDDEVAMAEIAMHQGHFL